MLVSAAVLLGVFGELPTARELPVFFGLALAMILASALKLRMPTTKNRATMSVSFVVNFTSLLLFGPHKAMLITAIGAISQSTIRVTDENPIHRVLFNIACLVTTVETSGVVYRVLGGGLAPLVWSHDATALLVGVIAYFL